MVRVLFVFVIVFVMLSVKVDMSNHYSPFTTFSVLIIYWITGAAVEDSFELMLG